jgi:hypothetical protein
LSGPTRSTTTPENSATGTYVSGTAPASNPACAPVRPNASMSVERYAGSENQTNIRQV